MWAGISLPVERAGSIWYAQLAVSSSSQVGMGVYVSTSVSVCMCVCPHVSVQVCVQSWVCVCVCKCMSQRIKQNDWNMPKLPLSTIFEEKINMLSWAKTWCSGISLIWRSSFLGDLEFSLWLLSISTARLRLQCLVVPSLCSGLWDPLAFDGASCLRSCPFPWFSEQSLQQEEDPCFHNTRLVAIAFWLFWVILLLFCTVESSSSPFHWELLREWYKAFDLPELLQEKAVLGSCFDVSSSDWLSCPPGRPEQGSVSTPMGSSRHLCEPLLRRGSVFKRRRAVLQSKTWLGVDGTLLLTSRLNHIKIHLGIFQQCWQITHAVEGARMQLQCLSGCCYPAEVRLKCTSVACGFPLKPLAVTVMSERHPLPL